MAKHDERDISREPSRCRDAVIAVTRFTQASLALNVT